MSGQVSSLGSSAISMYLRGVYSWGRGHRGCVPASWESTDPEPPLQRNTPGGYNVRVDTPPYRAGRQELAMCTTEFEVRGMTCAHCVSAVTAEVSKVAAVTGVKVEL